MCQFESLILLKFSAKSINVIFIEIAYNQYLVLKKSPIDAINAINGYQFAVNQTWKTNLLIYGNKK